MYTLQSVGSWIGWGIFIAFILVSVCCTLIALQRHGFLPKYTEETMLQQRLDEKITELGTCNIDKHDLNEKLQAQNLLPVVGKVFCQPMLEQSDANRKSFDDERTRKEAEIAECKTEKKELQDKIDQLKDEKLALKGVVMQTEAKLSALLVRSEQDGGTCEGWLCSGVKVLYGVVKDITADGKTKE